MIELMPIERGRMYLAQIDSLQITNDPASIRDRMLERRVWLSVHLDPHDYARALMLASAIEDRLDELGHANFKVSLKAVCEAAATDMTEARHAIELLGGREIRPGTYSNSESILVEIGDLGDLEDWFELT